MPKSKLEIETWSIDRIIPYHKNPRKNETSVDRVSVSLAEYGFQQPLVVDKAGVLVLIVGHTRLKAAKRLGFKEVPVVVATNLTEAQAKAYRIMDNKAGEESKWDMKLLGEELDSLKDMGFDVGLTGFMEPDPAVKSTLEIINRSMAEHGPGYLAFSGGTDSTVLVASCGKPTRSSGENSSSISEAERSSLRSSTSARSTKSEPPWTSSEASPRSQTGCLGSSTSCRLHPDRTTPDDPLTLWP
jgi:hypothetical protein